MSHSTRRTTAFEIKTPAALAALAKRFDPVVVQPDDETPTIDSSDYIGRMAITRNVEHDSGSYATIEVQPDNRTLANFIQYNIAANYPDYNVKGHPMVSPLSLAGYCNILTNALLLGCDTYYRQTKSHWAKSFHNDQGRKDYFEVLLNCKVPLFLADLLREIAPVYDARRTNVLFCPSLAGYSHQHDFGRFLPPQIWLHAHHLLATVNSRTDPDQYQAHIYDTNIVTFGTQHFRIGNFFGTHYGSEHPNWVNQDFEGFFNPLVGRALTQKPTFGKLHITPQTYANFAAFNTYEYALVADSDNCDNISNFVGSISAFFQAHDSKSVTLGSILASLSGALIFSHSIEPPTLPTWTGHKITPATSLSKAALGTSVSDTKFAEDHKFLVDRKKYSGTIDVDTITKLTNTLKNLLRIQKYDHSHTPGIPERVIFDPKIHVNPYVLYFQPYDVNASSIALTIMAGLRIEVAEIDGYTVPSEHPESSLDDNNSQILQSAIKLSLVDTILDSESYTTTSVRILDRRHVDRTNQAIGLSIRDMSRNVLPIFDNENINDTEITNRPNAGFTLEENHDDPRTAFTYAAGTTKSLALGNKMKIYLWSSYRILLKQTKPTLEDITMIASFRPMYGTNVTLSRSKNPALIIPH